MHVAATNPVAVDASGVDAATVERESAILREKNAGKPDHVLQKIVESGLKSYYKEVTLLEQPFVHDPSKSVAQVLKEAESQGRQAGRAHGLRALRPRRGHRKGRGAGLRGRSRRAGRAEGLDSERRRNGGCSRAAVSMRSGAETGGQMPDGERFRRVLVKLSGEALMAPDGYWLDPQTLSGLAEDLAAATARRASRSPSSSAAATSSAAPA